MTSEPRDWPFDSPPNVACLTVRSIVEGVTPILMASRDAENGAWQFLTGDAFDAAEKMPVSLANLVDRDPTLLQLADQVSAGDLARVLVLTTFDTDNEISRAIKAGARGYLLKDAPRDQLLDYIRRVHGARLVSRRRSWPSSPRASETKH